MADIKLNIYKGKEIEKTYTCEECIIEFGVVENVGKTIIVTSFNKEITGFCLQFYSGAARYSVIEIVVHFLAVYGLQCGGAFFWFP